MPNSDLALSRRLERAEAVAGSRFVAARARVTPESGAQWIEVAGAYAMFDGVRSPCTQTFGLGLFKLPEAADMDRIEAFFERLGAPVLHEVSPMADPALLGILSDRGYRPVELTSVMYLPLAGWQPSGDASIDVRLAADAEAEVWARTAAEGWSEAHEFAGLMDGLMQVMSASGALRFLAELDGFPIAAGAMSVHEGVALLAGASTIPAWRRRGAQRALLQGRLAHAAGTGCDLAMMCAAPGSESQRNAERQGFRIAYTRIKWGKRPEL